MVGGIACDIAPRQERCAIVRRQQSTLAAQQPELCCYVDNFDLLASLYDDLHFDADAKITVGQRMADALVAMPQWQQRQKHGHAAKL